MDRSTSEIEKALPSRLNRACTLSFLNAAFEPAMKACQDAPAVGCPDAISRGFRTARLHAVIRATRTIAAKLTARPIA
jgi:hypothetical protein